MNLSKFTTNSAGDFDRRPKASAQVLRSVKRRADGSEHHCKRYDDMMVWARARAGARQQETETSP